MRTGSGAESSTPARGGGLVAVRHLINRALGYLFAEAAIVPLDPG